MSLTISEWHQRYLQQARWTQTLRAFLYQRCGFRHAQRILDVGCGTGILEEELINQTEGDVIGIDKEFTASKWSVQYAPRARYATADCLSLPFDSETFDITLCHFLLLWINQPEFAISEMVRVTNRGGYVLALAEPDYGGRIDFPSDLSVIGHWQQESLIKQGADPNTGRKLRSLFIAQGLREVEAGVLGAQWRSQLSAQDVELEWHVLESDLEKNLDFIAQAEKYKAREYAAHKEQSRILFVPVFYALGKVPE